MPGRSQPGFSLLEMMIVLAIMIGVVSMVWPSLQRPMRKVSLMEAVGTVRSTLEDARYNAMISGQPQVVHLEAGSGKLQMGRLEDFLIIDDSAIEPLPTYQLPDGIEVVKVIWSSTIPAEAGGAEQPGWELSEMEPQRDAMQNESVTAWRLPILANGSGKDASIHLRNSTTGQSVWMVYSAATGAIETQ